MSLKEQFRCEIGGKNVVFELIAVLGPDDGSGITGEELFRRGEAIGAVTDREMAMELFLRQWILPVDWCFEGLLIVFPCIAMTEPDFQESFILGMEEDADGESEGWSLGSYALKSTFGIRCHFIRIVKDEK